MRNNYKFERNNYKFEQYILKSIDDLCTIINLKGKGSLYVLYDKERYDGELYLNIIIYDAINKEAVKGRFDTLINIQNYLSGLYFGIEFMKEG